MINEEKFKELLEVFVSSLGVEVDESVISDFITEVFPSAKPKKVKKVKHYLVADFTLEGEDLGAFNEDPINYMEECSFYMPSFSFDKGDSPSAREGEIMYVRVNGQLYSFTIHEGECVEASWSGSIYITDIRNLTPIDKDNESNYNLVEYNRW